MAFPVTKLEMERRKRFMSQWDLARLTGIIQTRLSLIERGQVKAKRQEIEEISKTLGIPFDEVEDLFREEANANRKKATKEDSKAKKGNFCSSRSHRVDLESTSLFVVGSGSKHSAGFMRF